MSEIVHMRCMFVSLCIKQKWILDIVYFPLTFMLMVNVMIRYTSFFFQFSKNSICTCNTDNMIMVCNKIETKSLELLVGAFGTDSRIFISLD